MNYITTIGLEVHVQLKTESKMFCACPVMYGAEPNENTCPTCLGLPGALPVLNGGAIEKTILAGIMLDCETPPVSKWDRKNYFYPDMPKNYQISQFDLPLCMGGGVSLYDHCYPKDFQKSITSRGKIVSLTRIHLEEDVAKSTHSESGTIIDFNRAGTPLMEIVSEPEIDSPEEAFAYLNSLRQVLIYGDLSDADMEKGQMRCDVNVSVRPPDQDELGVKIELKNMNSASAVRRALHYEINRQVKVLSEGGELIQSTRRWDDDLGETQLMRTKEDAHDYRYFPDPDLLPLEIEDKFISDIKNTIPELPDEKKQRYIDQYKLTKYDSSILISEKDTSEYFEKILISNQELKNHTKIISNWIISELFAYLKKDDKQIKQSPVSPENLGKLILLIVNNTISGKIAKEVFEEMYVNKSDPQSIIENQNLTQVTDTKEINKIIEKVLQNNQDKLSEYKNGKNKLFGFFVGQVMKNSNGKANPKIVNELLKEKLN